MAKDRKVANERPRGISEENWTKAQRSAAQQGVSPGDIIEKNKDPLFGLSPETDEEKKD